MRTTHRTWSVTCAATGLAGALLLSGCGDTGNGTGGNTGAQGSVSATSTQSSAPATPTETSTDAATESSTGGSSESTPAAASTAGVTRGAGTGDADVAVLIQRSFKGGKVSPEAGTVDVKVGDKVKVEVTSDSSQDIEVSGHPDAAADVDSSEAEGIDFTVSKAGDTTVRLKQADVVLVTVHAS